MAGTSNSNIHRMAYINNSPSAFLFNAKLQAVSTYGCLGDTANKNILIHPVQSADIITRIDSGCAPLTVNFYNNSHNSAFCVVCRRQKSRYIYQPQLHFTGSVQQDTNYEVKLVAINISVVLIQLRPKSRFSGRLWLLQISSASTCSPSAVSFITQSTGASDYFWNLGNGQTSSSIHPNATYTNYFFQDVSYESNSFCHQQAQLFCTQQEKLVTVHPSLWLPSQPTNCKGVTPLSSNFTKPIYHCRLLPLELW
jgi:PKD repeat protein